MATAKDKALKHVESKYDPKNPKSNVKRYVKDIKESMKTGKDIWKPSYTGSKVFGKRIK